VPEQFGRRLAVMGLFWCKSETDQQAARIGHGWIFVVSPPRLRPIQ